jgi:hypothetical protein
MSALENTVVENLIPSEFYLSQNYPNPFSEKTTIKYCIAYKTKVKIEVFSDEGKIIERLLDEEKEAGTYKIDFQYTGCFRQLANEIYSYRLEAGNFIETKKMILSR